MERSFAERVLQFNKGLKYTGILPEGIRIMNPFMKPEVIAINETFYRKYYGDPNPRKLLLGINPGRLGAGATGIPFTDTKRLEKACHIKLVTFHTHEPSSVFVYKVIEAYGGPKRFYGDFFINSTSPLGLLTRNGKGHWVNCNYYDFPELYASIRPFILDNLNALIGLGIDTSICYVLGKKNARFMEEINREEKLFGNLVVFDHPRYIVQYRSRQIDRYVADYIRLLSEDKPG